MASSSINTRLNDLPEEDLTNFGAAVLRILESFDEWNSETLDAIAEEARFYGLSTTDNHGFFMVKEKDDES